MTTTLTPTLAPLIDEIRADVRRGDDWADTAARVSAGLRDHLPALAGLEWDGPAAHRLHVETDGSFSVLAIVWGEDQWTRIHDHVTWCVFATLQGEVVEDLFDDGAGTLVPAGRHACPAGTVNVEVPPGDIHRLGNPHAETAVTLHVYGTDVTRLGTSARRTYEEPR
jgi:hypothetical protein